MAQPVRNGRAMVGLARPATPIGVFLHNGAPIGENPYIYLPHIECLSIQRNEGPDPGAARFRYKQGELSNYLKWPRGFDKLFRPEFQVGSFKYTLKDDYRLIVATIDPEKGLWPIFDGHIRRKQTDHSPSAEADTFECLGRAIKFWGKPLTGSWFRDGRTPRTVGANKLVPVPLRFNPDNRGNMLPTGLGRQANGNNLDCDTFISSQWIEPVASRVGDVIEESAKWSVHKAARYIIAHGCAMFPGVLKAPNLDQLEKDISGEILGPLPSPDPVIVRDVVCDGDVWPVALEKVLKPAGWSFVFRPTVDPNTRTSEIELVVFPTNSETFRPTKRLWVSGFGKTIRPGRETHHIHLVRDSTQVVNAVEVLSRPTRYMASFVLAPEFEIAASDKSPDNIKKARKSEDAQLDKAWTRKYRRWIFAEDGRDWWNIKTNAWTAPPANLMNGLFGATAGDWIFRPRSACDPEFGIIEANDIDNSFWLHVIKQSDLPVAFATNFGPFELPTDFVYDKTKVKLVGAGGWELLTGRLGIDLHIENPNSWDTGDGGPAALRKVNLIERWADPDPAKDGDRIRIILTCMVESDKRLEALAERQSSSPHTDEVRHVIDAEDRFGKLIIRKNSLDNLSRPTPSPADQTPKNDTNQALALAKSVRKSNELFTIAGDVGFDYFTRSYDVGDRIAGTDGRKVDFRVDDNMTDTKEVYPIIASLTWDFEGGQRTSFSLSDRRAQERFQ